MQCIVLRPFHHRGNEVIGLHFGYDTHLHSIIKKIKGIRWSQTNLCWYLPCEKDYCRSLMEATRLVAHIDTSQLKEYLLQKKAVVTDAEKPVHRTTMQLVQQYPLYPNNLQALTVYRNLMLLKNYSGRTIDVYCNAFHHLLRLLGPKDVSVLSKENLQSYLFWLYKKQGRSEAHIHTTVNALKFYYEQVLGRDKELYELPRPKKPSKLPDVLAEEEVIDLFKKIGNIKHRALLMTCYSAGLRVSELVKLQPADIDSKRMTIHIRSGKGNKDRFVPLANKVLEVLREYYKAYCPTKYLFEGRDGEAYSTRSVQEILKQGKRQAHVTKKGSVHSLRHSYATHLLENGTDIRYIKELLGHNNIATTVRYTHVARKPGGNIQSPIDRLKF